jgi:nicotinate-nucleotide pyrophosphorylase (carboxylating)
MTDTLTLRPSTVETLEAAGLDPDYVRDVVTRALDEDLAGGTDATTAATVPIGRTGTADLVARAGGVVAGLPVAAAVFDIAGRTTPDALTPDALTPDALTPDAPTPDAAGATPGDAAGGGEVRVEPVAADAQRVRPGDVLLTVRGPTRALLTAERTALNLLCHLSGVATLTRAWADALAGTAARVRDTRKTTPGLRALEKYAVRCGGGENHRMGLADAVLVKDNHVVAAGGVLQAFAAVRRALPDLPVQVECDSVEEVAAVLAAGADLVLLDNMTTADLRRAVELARPRRARLEASGGLTLDRALEVGETGVDYLAVGALTHSAPALDIGMDLRERDTP